MCCFSRRILSQGSSPRNLMQTSKVAPPQTSKEKNPTRSILSTMGIIESVRILVAISDWCASRRVVSVIFTGLVILAFLLPGGYCTPPDPCL